MNNWMKYLLLLVLPFCLSACHFSEWFGCKKTERCIIIYMDANNNLAYWANMNLQDLFTAVEDEALNGNRLMLFHNTSKGKNLYEIQLLKQGKDSYYADTLRVNSYDFSNALAPESMQTVLSDARSHAPADNYYLVLWSHSTGWLPENLDVTEKSYWRNASGESVHIASGASATSEASVESQTESQAESQAESQDESQDESLAESQAESQIFDEDYWWQHPPITKTFGMDGKNSITYKNLAQVLEHFDWEMILIDACFGAGVECLYDLRNASDYVVASPIEILGSGYPYAKVLPILCQADKSDEAIGREVCAAFMQYYLHEYSFNGQAYPYGALSLINLDEMDALAALSRELFQRYSQEMYGQQTVDHATQQALDNRSKPLFYDFYHYMKQVIPADELESWQRFNSQWDKTVLFHQHSDYVYSDLSAYRNHLVPLQHSSGLNVYLPYLDENDFFNKCNEAYQDLDWTKIMQQ